MNRFWSPGITELTPYTPGEQPSQQALIKLNTNELPFAPSPKVLDAIQAANTAELRLYPDSSAAPLRQRLAQHTGLDPAQFFIGNGSDEVLAFIFRALLKHSDPVYFPDITYSFYRVYCQLFNIDYREIPLDDSFSLQPQDYRPTAQQQPGGIIFANPNAPTGRNLPLTGVEEIVRANPHCVVVVDEAYVDFGGDSAIALLPQCPNLLVIQTFSKSYGLAGLRVGYAIGDPALIEALERIKNSFNSYPIDRLALAGACAAVDDANYCKTQCRHIAELRTSLTEAMMTLGFSVLPSAANFIFVSHPHHPAATLAQQLRERNILIRHFSQPRIENYLRISIGNEAQCAHLVAALRQIIGA